MINLSSFDDTIKKRDGLSLYVLPILKSVAGASVRAGRLSNQKCLVRRSNRIQSCRQNSRPTDPQRDSIFRKDHRTFWTMRPLKSQLEQSWELMPCESSRVRDSRDRGRR